MRGFAFGEWTLSPFLPVFLEKEGPDLGARGAPVALEEDLLRGGFGGARDIVMYTVTATYDKLFPLYGLIGMEQQGTMTISTVLKNQPYGQQAEETTSETKPCL